MLVSYFRERHKTRSSWNNLQSKCKKAILWSRNILFFKKCQIKYKIFHFFFFNRNRLIWLFKILGFQLSVHNTAAKHKSFNVSFLPLPVSWIQIAEATWSSQAWEWLWIPGFVPRISPDLKKNNSICFTKLGNTASENYYFNLRYRIFTYQEQANLYNFIFFKPLHQVSLS